MKRIVVLALFLSGCGFSCTAIKEHSAVQNLGHTIDKTEWIELCPGVEVTREEYVRRSVTEVVSYWQDAYDATKLNCEWIPK